MGLSTDRFSAFSTRCDMLLVTFQRLIRHLQVIKVLFDFLMLGFFELHLCFHTFKLMLDNLNVVLSGAQIYL